MTPRPHGSVEGQREWVLRASTGSVAMLEAAEVADGPRLAKGEEVRVVEAPVSPPERNEFLESLEFSEAAVEAILVAADRLREAYDAALDKRDVGRLAPWECGER